MNVYTLEALSKFAHTLTDNDTEQDGEVWYVWEEQWLCDRLHKDLQQGEEIW